MAPGGTALPPINACPLDIHRPEWAHIQRVLFDDCGDIPASARQLNRHRRTLPRKPARHPVKSRPATGSGTGFRAIFLKDSAGQSMHLVPTFRRGNAVEPLRWRG